MVTTLCYHESCAQVPISSHKGKALCLKASRSLAASPPMTRVLPHVVWFLQPYLTLVVHNTIV